jgi:hypothetical protein
MLYSTSKVKPARGGPSLLAAAQIRDNQPMRTPTVKRSSGSSTRLPIRVTVLSVTMASLLGLVGRLRPLGDCWQAWGGHLLGPPAWWAQVLARPGRPVSPGRLDDGRVKGRRRRSRRDAELLRSALDADGGQVAAHRAGNRPVRVRVQGPRTRRRRRGRSSPVTLPRVRIRHPGLPALVPTTLGLYRGREGRDHTDVARLEVL